MTEPDSSGINLRSVLMEIDHELYDEDIQNLAFLCEMTNTPENGREFFHYLKKRGFLGENNVSCLSTMLKFVGRVDLCRKLEKYSGVSADVDTKQYFSPFRGMLLNLSESLNDEEIDRMRFLAPKIPRKKKIEVGTELFTEMMRRDLLDPTNLKTLKDMLSQIYRRDLLETNIKNFETKYQNGGLPCKTEFFQDPPQDIPYGRSESACPQESLELNFSGLNIGSSSSDNLVAMETSGNCVTQEGSFEESLNHLPTNNISGGTASVIRGSDYYEEEDRYPMNADPRGFCVIINQEYFNNSRSSMGAEILKDRIGTDVDAASITRCFQHLRFEVKRYDNKNKREVMTIFEDLSKNESLQKHNAFVCFILSHGGKDYFQCTDGNPIENKEIQSFFTADKCRSLAHKPKVFFFVCCQGKTYQPAVETDCETDGRWVESSDPVHPWADFLQCYTTFPGEVSFRSRSKGTWYITDLIKMIDEHYLREDLLSILTKVSKEVSRRKYEYDGRVYVQQPGPLSHLRGKIYFN